MSLVLTENSSLVCANLFGTVSLAASESKLTVAGAKVLVTGDLSGALITGCPIKPPPATNVECKTITSVVGGVSTKLRVSGKGVLLETVKGTTSGNLLGKIQTWSVQSAGQFKLNAI